MSALGQKRTSHDIEPMSALLPRAFKKANIGGNTEGQSISTLPVISDVDLLCYGEGVVHLDAEIPDSALYLSVP